MFHLPHCLAEKQSSLPLPLQAVALQQAFGTTASRRSMGQLFRQLEMQLQKSCDRVRQSLHFTYRADHVVAHLLRQGVGVSSFTGAVVVLWALLGAKETAAPGLDGSFE